MKTEVIDATVDQKHVLANLFELYVHDFQDYDEESEIGEDGRFGFDMLDRYWSEPGRTPVLVRADGKLAGFALVRQTSALTGEDVTDMTEFFVMRRYRRKGVGEATARALFDRFPGRWQVRVMQANAPAQAFWRRTIGQYTDGAYDERPWDDERWRGPVLFFDNDKGVQSTQGDKELRAI